jgi:hypothetical protein
MAPIPAHDLSAHRHAEGQTPQRTRPPRIHPTRGALACRSAGADGATANPRAPGGSRRTLPPSGAGARRARSRRRGLQMAMSVRPCPGCSAVPAGTAGAGLREQDRAEMVKRIRLCLDRTDICTVTRGVARECVSFDACYRCGGSGKVQPPPLLRSGICQSRTPAPARYRPAASDGSGSTAKTAIPHDHRHQPRHGGTSTTRFGAGHGSDVSLFWVDSVPGSGTG